MTRYKGRKKAIDGSDSLMSFYRFINEPSTSRALMNVDMGRAIVQGAPQLFGRQYVAWRETRNLRMIANLRATYANRPGARVLVLVGASHKGYFERYLSLISDTVTVDTEQVPGAPSSK